MCLLARPDHLRRELTKSGTIPPEPKNNLLLTFSPWATRLGRFTLGRPKKKRPGGGAGSRSSPSADVCASITVKLAEGSIRNR